MSVMYLNSLIILYFSFKDMKLHYGDLTDSTCLVKIINDVKPTEIYNLGAQSHVKVRHFMFPYDTLIFILGGLKSELRQAPEMEWRILQLALAKLYHIAIHFYTGQ